MKVRDVMATDIDLIGPDEPVRVAAQLMADLDAGAVPVGENGKVVGILTDRDIILRLVAEGLDSNTPVRRVMSAEIVCCREDDLAEEVASIMEQRQIRRMPVLDENDRLVGIVGYADLSGAAGGRLDATAGTPRH